MLPIIIVCIVITLFLFSALSTLSSFGIGAAFIISLSVGPTNVAEIQYMFKKKERRGGKWGGGRREKLLGQESSFCPSSKTSS